MKFGRDVTIFSIVLAICALQLATSDKQTKSGFDLKWKFFIEDDGERMMLAVFNGSQSDHIVQCYSYGQRLLISKMLKKIPKEEQQVVDSSTINYLIHHCVHGKLNDSQHGIDGMEMVYKWLHKWLNKFNGLVIYPGTKWCGPGNVSSSYDDLGPEFEADTCCRGHDYCDDDIEGFESKHGLENNSPFTRSNCRCDDDFYKCLQDSNTRTSNIIGIIYFNIVESECFKLEHPILRCTRYGGWFRPTCQEYELDKEKDPIWQYFDARQFETPGEENENFSDDFNEDDLIKFFQTLITKGI